MGDKRLTVCRPGRKFPSVSVTGTRCDEMCSHCKGVHLRGMEPAETREKMNELTHSLVRDHSTGVLISGGCDAGGSVPVPFFSDRIRSMVDSGLSVNVHAGFMKKDEISELVDSGVSCFSVDVHQDPNIISSVLNLKRPPEDYSRLIDDILAAGGKVVPHITVGFGYDDLFLSADLIRSKGLKNVVLLALMPTKGTDIEGSVIGEDAVVSAVEILSEEMGLNVALGCMRDRSLRGLEKKCIEAGVRRIANPSKETVSWARDNGYEITEEELCCCMTF